jgi:poly-gamma-glutamate system protein
MKMKTKKLGSLAVLAGMAAVSCGIFFVAEKTTKPERQPYFERKIEAATIALAARDAIKEYERGAGIVIDTQSDPYCTGLIGLERTEITTGHGDLTLAMLSTNPNIAAAFVDMLVKARVKPHRTIAIGMNGSYPGLNISALAACYALDLRPIIITSVGASGYGANRPTLTWLDMEKILNDRDVFPFKSDAASIGGRGETGNGLTPEGRDLLRGAIKRNNILLIEEESVEANIAKRMEIYKIESRGKKITCYINIGGGVASLGGTQNARLIPPPGLTRHLAVKNYPMNGIINLMAEDSLPVINVLNARKIAADYGFPRKITEKEPPAGEGPLFFKKRDSLFISILLAGIMFVVVVFVIIIDVMQHDGKTVNDRIPITEDEII